MRSNFLNFAGNTGTTFTDHGTGGGTSFTLPVAATTNSVMLSIGGIMQQQVTDYSVSSTTVTTTTAVTSGVEVLSWIIHKQGTAPAIIDNTITSAKIIDGAITAAKIPDSSITAAKISANFASDKDIRSLALEIADVKGAALNFPNGGADAFDSDTLATKTNATYDASSDYYHNPGVGYSANCLSSSTTQVAQVADYDGGGNDVANLGNHVDGNTSTKSQIDVPLPGGSRFFVIDLGSGVTKTATKFTVHWQDHGDVTNYLNGLTISGSNDDASYTELLNETSGANANESKDYTWSNSTAYRYYKITVKSENTASGGAGLHIKEIYLYETAPGGASMTLINSGLTAASAPSTGFITVQADPVDSITVNTDLTAEISRDGGTTWTAVTLTAGSENSNFINYEGNVDISGQPSGTSMKYRVKTLNSKEIRVSGVVLRWT